MVTWTVYRCAKCGHETVQRATVLEVVHTCTDRRQRTLRPHRPAERDLS